MADTGSGVLDDIARLVEAGTRQALPGLASLGAANPAKTVVVQALSTNEGVIAVGGATVVAAPGSHAAPTARGVLLSASDTVSIDIDDPGKLFIDGTVTADAVSMLVLTA